MPHMLLLGLVPPVILLGLAPVDSAGACSGDSDPAGGTPRRNDALYFELLFFSFFQFISRKMFFMKSSPLARYILDVC